MMFALKQLIEILESLPDPAFILTRSGRYRGVFGGADSRYYHDGSSLIGKSIRDVLNDEKASWFLGEIDKALCSQKLHVVEYGLAGSDVKGLDSDGPDNRIYFEGRVQALDFPVEGEDAVLWVASNITSRYQLEEQLRSQSETDELTGLWNRRYLDRNTRVEKERAQRYGHPVSLLMFDVDHFKVINDTCGHGVGDAVLQELAKLVTGCTREADIVTRWGGEEFIILMLHASLDTAADVAEKIRKLVESHRFPHGYQVTISLGVAEWSIVSETFDMLLSRVDEALYQAKNSGRNCSVESFAEQPLFSSTDDIPSHTLTWRRQYESGNPKIDQQHRDLFDGANELLQLVPQCFSQPQKKGKYAEVIGIIDRLLSGAREHFATEERVLSRLDWPGLAAHQQEHQQLITRALELRQRLLEAPTVSVASELVNFLIVDVVANHILRSDRQYFSKIKTH